MESLAGKTLFITGASRGIGLAIAKRAALDGVNIAIAAKTVASHNRLPGTIYSAAKELENLGANALALKVDVRDERQIEEAVEKTVRRFGGIDICINNASAISLTNTQNTALKRFDLMHQVNARGTFAVTQACLPHLLKSENPHVLMLSPPIDMDPKWFKNHTPYTLSKYGMSMCVLGMAAELSDRGVAVNALWSKTVIDTAALAALGGIIQPQQCRSAQIVADSAYLIFLKPATQCTGQFFIDEQVLIDHGEKDFSKYAIDPNTDLLPDLFL